MTFSIIETENGEIFSYSICAGVAAIAFHENGVAFSVLAFKKAPLEAMTLWARIGDGNFFSLRGKSMKNDASASEVTLTEAQQPTRIAEV